MQPPPPLGHLIVMGGSVRAAVESAAGDGWAVTAIDRFGDADTRRAARCWHRLPPARDVERLLERMPPGPLVLTGGMEQWYERLESVRGNRPVLAPPAESIVRLRDPAYLQSVAQRSGFGFPSFRRPSASKVPPGWLAKSRRSAAGLGVCTSGIDPRDADLYLQQRVAGRPWGAAFLATGSSIELLGVFRSLSQSVGATPFLYSGSLGPLPIRAECQQKLLRLGGAVAQELSLRGLFGIDLLVDADGKLWLLELNPRITASMELLEPQPGPSLITRHVAAYATERDRSEAAGETLSGFTVDQPVRLKRIVWSRTACRWDPRWEQAVLAGVASVTLHDIPQPGTTIGRDEPLVSLAAGGRSMRDCLRAANEVASRLHKKCRSVCADRQSKNGWNQAALPGPESPTLPGGG